METVSQPERRVIRWPAVHVKTGRSRSQVWRDMAADKFPRAVQLGPNSIGWYADEIDAWLAARPRVRGGQGGADNRPAAA